MMLTQLADVARRTGYPVVEVKGWKTRGRPGEMLGVKTITCHHTANGGAPGVYPSLRVVRDGRKGLPGPLAQYGLGRDGTIFVIAAGRCNHAGVSRSSAYTNPYAIGIEAEAVGVPGTESDWPPVQMDAYARLCRALVEEFQAATVADVLGHKETCAPVGRKADPSFNMGAFRNKVFSVDLRKPIANQEVEVSLSPQDIEAIAAAVWSRAETLTATAKEALGTNSPTASMDTLLQFAPAVARLRREVDANDTARTKQIEAVKLQLDRIEAEQTEQRGVLDQTLTAVSPPPAEG